MKLLLPARLPANPLLAMAAAFLALVAIYPWVVPLAAPPGGAEISEPAPAVPTIASVPPLATLTAVFERPLFAPSRRAPAAERAPAPVSGVAGQYRLLGILTAGSTSRALISDGNRRLDVLEGTRLDGWTVSRIEGDRLILSSPTGEMLLKLPRAGEVAPEAPAQGAQAR